MEVAYGWIVVLEQVSVFERVGLIWHLLERLSSDLLPVVGGFELHEEAVLHEFVDGGSHLRVAQEHLGEEFASDHVDALLAYQDLARQNLLLNLHRVLLLLKR